MKIKKKVLFLLLLVLGTAFWGISFSVTKLALGDYSPSTFLFCRFLGATGILSLIFFRYLKQVNWRIIKIGAFLSVPLTFGIYMQTLGIRQTSASQCAFIAGICVVIIPILKTLFYKTIIPRKMWLASVIALMGLAIISIKENFNIGVGDLYTLIGAFGFAYYLISVEIKSGGTDLIANILPMFASCTLWSFLYAITESQAIWLPADVNFWVGIGFCALFSTAYMYTVSNLSQRYLSAEKVAIIYLFEPIFGAIAAYCILGEKLSLRLLIGGLLIFLATLISELNLNLSKFK